jgi:hypothetical protein
LRTKAALAGRRGKSGLCLEVGIDPLDEPLGALGPLGDLSVEICRGFGGYDLIERLPLRDERPSGPTSTLTVPP